MPEEDLHLPDQTRFQAHKPQAQRPGLRYSERVLGDDAFALLNRH
jgi:hypothetical protein